VGQGETLAVGGDFSLYQRELGLAEAPEPPDISDALAAALCHYYVGRLSLSS